MRRDEELRIGRATRPEAAAHVRGDHADAVLRQAEHDGQEVAHAARLLGRRPDGQLVGRLVVAGDDGARLHWRGRDARVGDAQRDAVLGAGERGVDVAGLAHHAEADVVGEVRIDLQGVGGERGLDVGHGVQRLVVDLDQRRRVGRRGP